VLKEGKIGVFETTTLLTILISTKVLFSSGRELVELVGPAAWYEAIISGITALVGFFLILMLLDRFPGRELAAIMETVFGRVAGSIFSLVIGATFFVNAALTLREFAEAVKVYEYPLSPISFIMIFFILAVVTMLYLGFEAIARTAALFAWPLLAGVAALFLLPWPLYKIYNLFPLFGHGLGKTVTSGLLRSSTYGEILALAVIGNSVQGFRHVKKTGVTALIITIMIFALFLFCYILAFPYFIATESTIPLLNLTRMIEYGAFFQRFESIFLFVWSIASILAVGINLYVALSIYCKVFKMDDHRAMVLPLSIMLFSAAILLSDISSIAFDYVPFFRQFGSVIFFGFPILALLVASARGKKGDPGGA